MDWKGKAVLVTGAGGFIGSHLTEKLAGLGADVRAFVHYNALGSWGWLDESPARENIDVLMGDVCDRDSVRRAMEGREVVFHLAALIAIPYSYQTPASYVRTNVEGTLNILQAARELHVERVVHTSTSEVYGSARYVPIDEGHPLQAQSPYAASKTAADKLAEAFRLSFDLPVVTVRPFNTFGPRQSVRAIIPAIITQCLVGDTVRLGNVSPTRDFNYVDNTVDGFVRAACIPEAVGQTINLGSGKEISIGELAELIGKMTHRKIKIDRDATRVRPEKSEVDRLVADSSRARKLLEWEPAIDFKNGLGKTIDWFTKNLGTYRVGSYTP